MARIYIDPRNEITALSRAATLLRRVRQDEDDREIEALEEGVSAMKQAAAEGELVLTCDVSRLEDVLSHMPAPAQDVRSARDLVRRATLVETGELLHRLHRMQ